MLPFTRTQSTNIDGVRTITNEVNGAVDAFDVRTGTKLWSATLKTPYGDGTPNKYDTFGYKGAGVNGMMVTFGLGGDIWAFNGRTGAATMVHKHNNPNWRPRNRNTLRSLAIMGI